MPSYKKAIKALLPLVDAALAPVAGVAALEMKLIRRIGIHQLPICRRLFRNIGIFPLQDHYYDPLFNPKHLRHSLRTDRDLPGVDWNVDEQLEFLSSFDFNDELVA